MGVNSTPTPVTSYNDNSIPFGGIGVSVPVHFYRGQTSPADLGQFLIEMVSTKRPSKMTERPDQLGGPNGWSAVLAQVGGTAKVQLPLASTGILQLGDYFSYTFDATIGVEKLVIVNIDQTYQEGQYWFQTVELKKAYYT